MKRKQRTRLLIDFGKEEVLQMAAQIEEHYAIEMISEPNEALTMIKMRETAQNSLFYIGEVLVTETKVRINGKVGLGIVKGNQETFSKALAIIDAAYNADLAETKTWLEILEELNRKGQEIISQRESQLAQTKVNFETMNQ